MEQTTDKHKQIIECSWCGGECLQIFKNRNGENFCSNSHRTMSNRALKKFILNAEQNKAINMTETTDKPTNEQQSITPRKPRTHDDYLLSQGRKHYEYARKAIRMEQCLYWLERYYDANTRYIQRIAKRQRMAQQQQKQLQKTLRNNKGK